jgi:hypothetical protein
MNFPDVVQAGALGGLGGLAGDGIGAARRSLK